jgi:phenylpyruvate tautomerase PptA (4-oxalocrotonate tautomerase family)
LVYDPSRLNESLSCEILSERESVPVPLVRIEVRRGRSPVEKKALLEGVHSALVEALKIPDDDRTQRLCEHSPEDFEIPPTKTDKFTLVEITMFPGRSISAKRHLYQAIVRNLGLLGIAPTDVLVVLHEPAMESWGLRGGLPASEVDLGFKVDV